MMAALFLAATQPMLNPIFTPQTMVEQMQNTPSLILGVLELSLALVFLALWRAAPDFRVFRLLGWFYAILAIEQFMQYAGAETIDWMCRAIAVAVLVETAGEAMGVPNRGWTKLFWPFYFLGFLGAWIPSLVAWRNFGSLSEVPLAILIYQCFRRGNRFSRMIGAAFTLHFLVRITIFPVVTRFTGLNNYIPIGSWRWRLTALTLTILGTTTLALFVRDLIHDRREKQRLATELEAARAIQQLLIPEVMPTVPGLEIRAVYRPFGEVGGDFFQILPLHDGRALIAIGDVSGKGVPAALQVSLLAGTLRAMAEYIDSPAAILTALNRHMTGRSNGGFTTCLLLRIDAVGQLIMANAGHIAPYRAGAELRVENGLPLGLVLDAAYEESVFTLGSREQLTLITDGIVEARSKTGELFGFDRTAAISTQSAEAIASSAQAFGQDDDITVLTLIFAPKAGFAEVLDA